MLFHRNLYGEPSGSVVECFDSRLKGSGLERHCVVYLRRHINPCLVLVQPKEDLSQHN